MIKIKRRRNTIRLTKKQGLWLFIIILLVSIYAVIYAFDRNVIPTITTASQAEMKAKAIDVINKAVIEEYSNNFKYDEIIKIDKDNDNNIVMVRADTIKLNKIAAEVSSMAQGELQKLGYIGISLPLGYVTKNNILSDLGPNIKIKMQPIGTVETKYYSEFESAGINQTRHKIYVEVTANIKVIIPTSSSNVSVKYTMPVAETIIVGKIPNTSISMDLNKAFTGNN